MYESGWISSYPPVPTPTAAPIRRQPPLTDNSACWTSSLGRVDPRLSSQPAATPPASSARSCLAGRRGRRGRGLDRVRAPRQLPAGRRVRPACLTWASAKRHGSAPGISLEIPGDVFADLLTSFVLTERLDQQVACRASTWHLLLRGVGKVGPDPSECASWRTARAGPGSRDQSPPCAAGLLDHLPGVLGGPDVAVAEHR